MGANKAEEGAMGDGPKKNHRSKTFKLHNTTWQAPFSIILEPSRNSLDEIYLLHRIGELEGEVGRLRR